MTKEDIMVCKMIGKIGEKWVVSLHLFLPGLERLPSGDNQGKSGKKKKEGQRRVI
jgi:hypothetical protein